MSTFYLVLIVFLLVIGLLCLISCVMYCCHVLGGSEKNIGQHSLFPNDRKNHYDPAGQRLLDRTGVTTVPDGNTTGVEMTNVYLREPTNKHEISTVNVRDLKNKYENSNTDGSNSTSIPQRPAAPTRDPHFSPVPLSTTSRDQPAVTNRSNFRYNKQHASSEDITIGDASNKPAIAVKPIIHSMPASKRNSLTRPADAPPPPPPTYVEAKKIPPLTPKKPLTHSTSSINKPKIKPKAPPPPVPVANEPKTETAPLPSYSIYEKHVDNYLCDS